VATLSNIACVLLLAGAACTPAGATMPATTAPAVLLSAAQDGALDLGAVIDFRRVDVEGVTVLAVTPGGLGERLGLRAGDRIVAANGQSLAATNRPSSVLATALSGSGAGLRLDIVRDGQRRTLSGALDGQGPVADKIEGCGHISSGGTHPRATRDVFPVVVLSIDGDHKLPVRSGYYRVDAGRRVLVVRELIDGQRFSEFGLKERARQRERHGARLDKVLIVDVQPDTSYFVGAQTSRPISTSAIRDNSYWEPVVWRTVAESCR